MEEAHIVVTANSLEVDATKVIFRLEDSELIGKRLNMLDAFDSPDAFYHGLVGCEGQHLTILVLCKADGLYMAAEAHDLGCYLFLEA